VQVDQINLNGIVEQYILILLSHETFSRFFIENMINMKLSTQFAEWSQFEFQQFFGNLTHGHRITALKISVHHSHLWHMWGSLYRKCSNAKLVVGWYA